MKIVQAIFGQNQQWKYIQSKQNLSNPLVLVFGNRMLLENQLIIKAVRNEFPYNHIVFGSTSGEIINGNVLDNTITVTAIEFEKSTFVIKRANIFDYNKEAEKLGEALCNQFSTENLKHLFVLSDGSFINGSSLVQGIETRVQTQTFISGGMCGDDAKFEKTLSAYNENPKSGEVIMIGFYGATLEISIASFGGWIPFGPERLITKSEANTLYEIDNLPALELYKKYLGDKGNQLPQASLLYPLNVKEAHKERAVVRTILSINEDENSMTLAGDVPLNAKVQLMMASVDGLSQGAYNAAKLAMKNRQNKPELALLVSCVGRKLVMNQRVEEEIEEVQNVIGKQTAITGFYSYGEIAPFAESTKCELHNQTMTLTLISE